MCLSGAIPVTKQGCTLNASSHQAFDTLLGESGIRDIVDRILAECTRDFLAGGGDTTLESSERSPHILPQQLFRYDIKPKGGSIRLLKLLDMKGGMLGCTLDTQKLEDKPIYPCIVLHLGSPEYSNERSRCHKPQIVPHQLQPPNHSGHTKSQ
jgi:hypothetical protein